MSHSPMSHSPLNQSSLRSTATKDDRRYFRILDFIGLAYRPIDNDEYESLKQASQYAEVPALDALSEIDQHIQLLLDRLKIKHKDFAELGMLLSSKIQLVIESSNLGDDLQQFQDIPQLEVDMSACGIAFPTTEDVKTGQLLELDLVLASGRQHLKLLAKVVASETEGHALIGFDKSYSRVVRTEFLDVSEQIQEFLIQYVVKRQGALLKAGRRTDNNFRTLNSQ